MIYIAYGSNMNVEQMAFRCPNAKVIGTGYIEDYRLEFYLHATIDNHKNSKVPVVVWEVNKNDEKSLDRYEGFPSYYIKKKLNVRLKNGKKIKGMVYIMNIFRDYPPTQAYVDGIIEGYKHFGFNEEIGELNEAIKRSKLPWYHN